MKGLIVREGGNGESLKVWESSGGESDIDCRVCLVGKV